MRTMTVALLLTGVFGVTLAAQELRRDSPVLPGVTAGAELYRAYCASCHGLDGRGRPAATSAHLAAPDLTTIARRRDGRFPRDEVRTLIVNGGTHAASHAPTAMPKWGAIFRAVAGDDGMAEARVESLLDHLERLQESVVRPQSSH